MRIAPGKRGRQQPNAIPFISFSITPPTGLKRIYAIQQMGKTLYHNTKRFYSSNLKTPRCEQKLHHSTFLIHY
jgi:hypothetical protein